MNYLITHVEEHDVIRIDFFGTIHGLNEVESIMKNLRLTADYFTCPRILCDVRDVRVVDRFSDMYQLGSKIAASGVVRNYSTAILFAEDETKHRIVEKVLCNRGYRLKLFREEDDALKWIN
ncbi:MAG: hypothetical protein V2I50_13685 [Desulfuromusa sp.]|jgi:hypothetical protein|nr:hypothetical protein [Desulfuromusa sp.]